MERRVKTGNSKDGGSTVHDMPPKSLYERSPKYNKLLDQKVRTSSDLNLQKTYRGFPKPRPFLQDSGIMHYYLDFISTPTARKSTLCVSLFSKRREIRTKRVNVVSRLVVTRELGLANPEGFSFPRRMPRNEGVQGGEMEIAMGPSESTESGSVLLLRIPPNWRVCL